MTKKILIIFFITYSVTMFANCDTLVKMKFKIEVNKNIIEKNIKVLFFDLCYKSATISTASIDIKEQNTIELRLRDSAWQIMFKEWKFKVEDKDSLYILVNDYGHAFGKFKECKISDTIYVKDMNFLEPYKSKNCQITLVDYRIISNYEEFKKKCVRKIFKSHKRYITSDGVCIDCYNEMRDYYHDD